MDVTYVLHLDLSSTRAHALQTVRTAAALSERGVHVHLYPRVVAGVAPGSLLRDRFGVEATPRLHLHPVPSHRDDRARARQLLHLAPALVRGRDDHVLFVRDRRSAVPVLSLWRWLGRRVPFVYEFHNLDHVLARERGQRLRSRRIRRQERRIAREADGLVAVSEPLAQEVREGLGPRGAVTVIPSGADLESFLGCGRPRLGGHGVRLVYAGSLYPEKGVDTLIKSMATLPERFSLTIVGGNTARDLDRVRRLIGFEGVRHRVHLVGQVEAPRVADHLSRADVVVIPGGASAHSLRFASPLKLFEALATGVPVVVGSSTAYRSVVEPEDLAEVAEGPGPRALAEAVLRAVEAPDRALERARRAARWAQGYSWTRRAERMESMLREVVARRRGSSR